jgi:hypothetical protein
MSQECLISSGATPDFYGGRVFKKRSFLEKDKGQLMSKGLFGVIVSTKKQTIILRISALASKQSSNKKKILYTYLC